ncbi:MAG: hypothetical protein KatS3mg110_1038 [Pirellulaceae bacterium]|nr:MAG: hypothetical protein KatS3mg110_1038 [Pirellulaceae bacterium]
MTAQVHTETKDYWLVPLLRLVALLLMAAGGLKLGGLWFGANRAIDPCFSTGSLAAFGFVEIVFGGVLLFGADRWPRPLAWAAMAVFSAFLITNIGVSGAADCRDCGCLGPIAVTPRIMAVADSLVLALLLLGTLRGPLLWAAAWAVLPVMISAAWAWLDYRWETAHERLFARVDVRQWVGLPFPLAEALDGAQESRHGKWVVLLYNGRCGRCDKELKLLEQRSVPIAECKRAVVLLSESQSPLPSQAAIWRVKQTARPAVEAMEPPFQLPAYLLLSEGRVVGAAMEWGKLQWDALKIPPTELSTSKEG